MTVFTVQMWKASWPVTVQPCLPPTPAFFLHLSSPALGLGLVLWGPSSHRPRDEDEGSVLSLGLRSRPC